MLQHVGQHVGHVTAASGAIALLVALVELLSLPNSLGAHLTGRFWSLVEAANDHFELLGIAPRHSSTGTQSTQGG